MQTESFPEARLHLNTVFQSVERDYLSGKLFQTKGDLSEAFDILFQSNTQAFREVLLGVFLEKIFSPQTNLRLPYVGHGEGAYNGRTLDERIVNPFLRHKKIPCSKGPFLSVFRRSVKFDESTREGVRDKRGYDAFLTILSFVERENLKEVHNHLRFHLYRFLLLREDAQLSVARINRISLEQCDWLLQRLLKIQSGGRIPVFVAQSLLLAIKQTFHLNWQVECQGINVSDKASGACGDISVTEGARTVLAIEITERRLDQERVISTFDTKIAPNNLEDYIFLIGSGEIDPKAYEQAQRYFALGHDVNFLEIRNWTVTALSLLGAEGRNVFLRNLIGMFDAIDVPKTLKVFWNQLVSDLTLE